MSVFKSSLTLLFVVLCIQAPAIFLPGQAYAWSCCGCSCRALGCYCPGQGGCIWYPCNRDENITMQAKTITDSQMLDISGDYDQRPHATITSNIYNRFARLNDSEHCAKNNVMKTLFSSSENQLKFDREFLKHNVSEEEQVLAGLIRASE
jgi:hypothetical protein